MVRLPFVACAALLAASGCSGAPSEILDAASDGAALLPQGAHPDVLPDTGAEVLPDIGAQDQVAEDGAEPSLDAGQDAAVPDSGPDVCVPQCAGKQCGDDGCGGSCGECTDDDICTVDTCDGGQCQHLPAAGPCQWAGQWALSSQNPVLSPTPADPDQGSDNVYAADVLWHDGRWWMWYGGQGSDGHDAIFLARSNDLVTWQKHPSWVDPTPVVDHGGANHVNDPSVVLVGGTFYMYYTEAPTGENDRVHLATSADGESWTKNGMVLDVGPPGSWEPDRVGRPSVLYEEGQFRMWYDGQVYGVARHVGYATSADGFSWTRHPDNPVVLNEGAVDVDRVGEWYVMLAESGSGTRFYVAKDPLHWKNMGQLFGLSGAGYDGYGQVTPNLLTSQGNAVAIFVGGASNACWCKNRIAVAFPGSDVAGCNGCLAAASSCQAACNAAGHPLGMCGAPGSVNPSACCACCDNWACEAPPEDCSKCLAGYPTCTAACKGAGKSGGWCAVPGSTDPSACCACF